MSDLSPECAPKRTSADRFEFMASRPWFVPVAQVELVYEER